MELDQVTFAGEFLAKNQGENCGARKDIKYASFHNYRSENIGRYKGLKIHNWLETPATCSTKRPGYATSRQRKNLAEPSVTKKDLNWLLSI